MWQLWVSAFLGLWVMAIPFIGISSTGTFTWTLAITGLLIAALSAWGAMQVGRSHEYRERTT
jgi:hypothetical protein